MMAVEVIRDIVAMSCRDSGVVEGVSTERRRLPCRAEGGVGGTVSGDGQWTLAWISESEASSAQV